jgi:predicted permease
MRPEHWLYTLPLRLRSLFRRNRVEHELDDELRYHLEQQIQQNLAAGMSKQEARSAALRAFGGVEQAKEICRETRRFNFFEDFVQDIRYGLRILGRTPVLTSVVILSLALGIGANTAIFGLIDAVLIRLLPVQKPEQLVQIRRSNPRWGNDTASSFTNPLWEELHSRQDIFSGILAWSNNRFNLAQGGEAHYADGIYVSGEYFNTLGVRTAAGRLFTAADDQRGCPALAALSYAFWQEHFGGAQSAIGSSLSLDNQSFQIIGVSAPRFDGIRVGSKFDVAVPICTTALYDSKESRLDERFWWWLEIVGRVKQGLTPEQLKARLAVLSPQVVAAAGPQSGPPEAIKRFQEQSIVALPGAAGSSGLRRQFGEPLYILMGVVGLVLLIACANIASLMLARATARSKEIAVRKALGASRLRLVRQLLTECVLLSSAGAILGIFLARWGNTLLVRYISTGENKVFLDLSLDGRVLGFTAVIAVFTGILFGVLPAFRSTRVSLTAAMKGGRGEESEHSARFRPGKWIVASQIALSLVLLVTAGLFLHSLVRLITLDIGFDRTNVLLVNANLGPAHIPPEQGLATFEALETRFRSLPGVISVGGSWRTPVSDYEWNQNIDVDTPGAPKGDDALTWFNFVSPDYFETLRTPLLAGRGFDNRDVTTSPRVAIVNQTFARKFFPGANPVGKSFRIPDSTIKSPAGIQIVGLVIDSKYSTLREENYPTAFFPMAQIPRGGSGWENFEIRTSMPPTELTAVVQEASASINRGISLEFHTLAEQVDDSLVQERVLATLSCFFGGLALLLAMVGLYGAISHLVTQRQTEFGVRKALGALPASILRLVMRDVAAILLGGAALGIGISLATVRLLEKLLFNVTARDPFALAASVGILAAVAFFAAYLPARRAMRVDPMVALRYE